MMWSEKETGEVSREQNVCITCMSLKELRERIKEVSKKQEMRYGHAWHSPRYFVRTDVVLKSPQSSGLLLCVMK